MKDTPKTELIRYEIPSIGEYVAIPWLQTLMGWYVGTKIDRKLARYNRRLERDEFVRRYLRKIPRPKTGRGGDNMSPSA